MYSSVPVGHGVGEGGLLPGEPGQDRRKESAAWQEAKEAKGKAKAVRLGNRQRTGTKARGGP